MNKHAAHEPSQIAVRPLHWIAAGLAGSVIAIMLAMFVLWKFFLTADPPTQIMHRPPAPRLQPDPARDLASEIAAQQRRLNGYVWVNREAGIAQIPIDRAMRLLVRQQPAQTTARQSR